MAPTEGSVARSERRWGCRRGYPHLGSRDVNCHVTLRPTMGGFLQLAHWHRTSISHGFPDIKPRIFRVMTLTIYGHVTSLVKWP